MGKVGGAMAAVYGTCGAWKGVLHMLRREPSDPWGPNDLANTITRMTAARSSWWGEAELQVRERVAAMRGRIPRLQGEVTTAVDDARRRIGPQVERCRGTIEGLAHARYPWVRWYNRLWRIPAVRVRMAMLESEQQRAGRSQARALAAAQAELAGVEGNPRPHVERLVADREATLHRLQAVAASPEHAGAVGELAMAHALASGLSDAYHVFHDVRVEMGDWVYVNRKHRRSAQVDHVVVGPGGVFALEDKLWSRAFAEQGDYHDPYEQVRGAATLLHFALKERTGRKVRVREILVARRNVPPKPPESYAKVLAPAEVCGYVRWFKQELDPQALNEIVVLLRGMC